MIFYGNFFILAGSFYVRALLFKEKKKPPFNRDVRIKQIEQAISLFHYM